MASINHLITLGVGTPASIQRFILLGLSPYLVSINPEVIKVGADDRVTKSRTGDRAVEVEADDRVVK